MDGEVTPGYLTRPTLHGQRTCTKYLSGMQSCSHEIIRPYSYSLNLRTLYTP